MSNEKTVGSSAVSSAFSAIVRAGLNAAPFAGGVASLWSDWDTSRRFARVERAITELGKRLEMAQPPFDPAKLGDAEMHLLEDALSRISREHREWKRRNFVDLLSRDFTNTETPFEERELFHRALDAFEKIHIQILRVLADRVNKGLPPIDATELCRDVGSPGQNSEFTGGVFMPAMTLLATGYGFIRRQGKNTGNAMINVNPDGLTFMVDCSIRSLGHRFVVSLGKSDSEQTDPPS